MKDFPWFVFVIVPVVGYVFFMQRRKLAGALSENADKTLGAIARRLHLQVTEGDPNVNLLIFQQPTGNFKRTFRAQGAPYGRGVTFLLMDGQKTSEYIVARRTTVSFGCYLQTEISLDVPAFELSLRSPNEYLVPHLDFAERPELSTVSTGDPALDRLFVIRAADPRLAPALAPALQLLSAQHYVHLAGEGQKLWISISQYGLINFSSSAEAFLHALEAAACALEGRPAPGQLVG